MNDNGWDASAAAWIESMGEHGDASRRYVLDGAMLARVHPDAHRAVLDVGCGEGRFCRILREHSPGATCTGVDLTAALIERARELDPNGEYRVGKAEALPYEADSFDLVVSYLTLIDIDDVPAALAEMTRVLRPGGSLLIANLNSFATANNGEGWRDLPDGTGTYFPIDDYMVTRANRVSWSGINIVNWHRPMSFYMQALLSTGLRLVHFDEPLPKTKEDARYVSNYQRIPYFHVMEWVKG